MARYEALCAQREEQLLGRRNRRGRASAGVVVGVVVEDVGVGANHHGVGLGSSGSSPRRRKYDLASFTVPFRTAPLEVIMDGHPEIFADGWDGRRCCRPGDAGGAGGVSRLLEGLQRRAVTDPAPRSRIRSLRVRPRRFADLCWRSPSALGGFLRGVGPSEGLEARSRPLARQLCPEPGPRASFRSWSSGPPCWGPDRSVLSPEVLVEEGELFAGEGDGHGAGG